MTTCYLEPGKWAQAEVELSPEEARHLATVLRAERGKEVRLVDGRGRVGRAEVLHAHGSHAALRMLEQSAAEPLVPRRILVQAPARGQRMDWLLQKATELGCHEIWPMMTARAVVRIAPQEAEKKSARWQAVALAACKQSGNAWMPEIAPARTFKECLAAAKGRPSVYGCLTPEARPLSETLRKFRSAAASEVLMFVGPEGDFTPEEDRAMLDAGVQPVTLGPTVLRVETAAIYLLSAVAYEWSAGGV